MGRLPEPDDVDIVVDGRDYDPASHQETIDFIKARKSRPEYAEEIREAYRILESLGMNTSKFGDPDPGGLLAQWRRNVEEIKRRVSQETAVSGESADGC